MAYSYRPGILKPWLKRSPRSFGNKALRERMGAMGREIVLKQFRAELIAEATIAEYDRLLGTGGIAFRDRNNPAMRSLTGTNSEVRAESLMLE